jgi:RNA polymerase sigma factor (sigma-70 family)
VTPRSLQTVLRALAECEPPASDAELLRQFLQGNEAAFTELVRRYGRLVWTVCRHLTGSDTEADDAFQATFLVLLRNTQKIRDASRLPAWLHGVAYRVCAKARQATKRRTCREQAAASPEHNGHTVADSAWDRALAAVHEEVAKLPETLRVPFVLCCLEGLGTTEAAEQLGWKLGTFSGRLSRAKDALLARLDARGLTLGALAGLCLATPPASAVAKATCLTQIGVVVPSSVLQLTQGVFGMSMKSVKLLVAAVLVSCGLGLGAGTGWIATAEAQPPVKQPPTRETPPDVVKRLAEELEKAKREAEEAFKQAENAKRAALLERDRAQADTLEALQAADKRLTDTIAAAKTAKWEYDFVTASDLTQSKFVELLQDRENRGWEFSGTTSLLVQGKPTATWVFRRLVKGAAANLALDEYKKFTKDMADYSKRFAPGAPKADEVKAIEDEIAKLQDKLAALKAKKRPTEVVFAKGDLPLDPVELVALLNKLAAKKFNTERYTIKLTDKGLSIDGDKEVIEWATALIKKLSEK